jgi:hypothetical protein
MTEQPNYTAIEIYDTHICYDGVTIYTGRVKGKSQDEINAIVNAYKKSANDADGVDDA